MQGVLTKVTWLQSRHSMFDLSTDVRLHQLSSFLDSKKLYQTTFIFRFVSFFFRETADETTSISSLPSNSLSLYSSDGETDGD